MLYNNVYILGDIHGSFKPVRSFFQKVQPKEDDVLILLGDAGLNFWFDYRDKNLKEKLGKYKIKFFVIRGNHEQRPSVIYNTGWHIEPFFGGSVMVEDEYPYIKYAADGPFAYEIYGKSVLSLPVAYSVDKYYRLENNHPWFPQEQMNYEERFMARMMTEAKKDWSIVLSHICPMCYQPTDLFLSTVNQSMVDNSMERFLGEIERNIHYDLWVFAHFHSFRVYPKVDESERIMLFNDKVLDLKKFLEYSNPYDAVIDIL